MPTFSGAKDQDVLASEPSTGEWTITDENGNNLDRYQYGGRGRNVYKLPDGTYVSGPNQAERDAARYRSMGEAAANRSAATLDQEQALKNRNLAHAARQQQMNALALQRTAAEGRAPSRAELLGRKMIDDSLDAQMAAAASSRGGAINQVAAQRAAANAGAAARARGLTELSALRADELARARGDYMAGASGIRSGDFQAEALANDRAKANLASEMNQRGLNQAGQLAYEGMGYDVNKLQLDATLREKAINQGQAQFDREMDMRERDRRDQQTAGVIQGVAAGGAQLWDWSDERTKEGVTDLSDPSWLDDYMAPIREDAKPYERSLIEREDPYTPDAPAPHVAASSPGPAPKNTGELIRDNPYGEGPAGNKSKPAGWSDARRAAFAKSLGGIAAGLSGMFSDERTKKPVSDSEAKRLSAQADELILSMQRAKQAGPSVRSPLANEADEHMAGMRRSLDAGPAVHPMADANRAMAPIAYQYKDGFAPPNQAPGETNIGPSANRMAASPVSAQAVKRDPNTGLLMVDKDKALKQTMGGVGYLQQRQDETDAKIDALASMLQKRRK